VSSPRDWRLCSVLLTIDVNAFSRTLGLGFQYGVLQLGWHCAIQLNMSQPIVLHLEDIGAKILAEAIPGAILLFNPYIHHKLLSLAKTMSTVAAELGVRAIRPSGEAKGLVVSKSRRPAQCRPLPADWNVGPSLLLLCDVGPWLIRPVPARMDKYVQDAATPRSGNRTT